MKKEAIATLFTALRGGVLREIRREESTVRFQIELPELAQEEDPAFQFFYAALLGCDEFFLQPFRNESTVVTELDQIERLEVEILEARAEGERIKIFCAHRGVSNGARLSLKSNVFQVYNGNFDALTVRDLLTMRESRNPGS